MATSTDAKSTPATPRPRGAARRDALLQATLTLVGEVGADALTHRRVAQAAGLPLASTTYWFDSKEQLLTEALQFAAERDLVRLHTAAGALDAHPTVAQIIDVAVCSDQSNRGALLATYTLMLEAARRPALQAISRRWTDGYLETVGELLARAGSQRPQDDARLLIAATDGLLIDRLAAGAEHDFDPRPDLERLVGALLHGNGAR